MKSMKTMENPHVLSVKNLKISYGNKKIIENLSFDLAEGELICLCGPNGSGKSSLLSVLAGINFGDIKFSKNSVFYSQCRQEISDPRAENEQRATSLESLNRNELSRQVSFMVQNENCTWNFPVEEFIMMGRYVYGDEKSEHARSLVKKYMNELEISHLAEREITTFSGGEMQKARIARSLVQETPILLLDEPCSNLDFDAQFTLMKKIRSLCHSESLKPAENSKNTEPFSVIVSIHDLNLASIFADKILLLNTNENANEKSANESKTSTNENKAPFFFGTVGEIFRSEILSAAFNTNFGIFTHPEYKVPQVYVK